MIRTIEVPKRERPEKPKEIAKPHPVEQVATSKLHVSPITIKPDRPVKITMTDVKELEGKEISDQQSDGPIYRLAKPAEQPSLLRNRYRPSISATDFIPIETQPEFPWPGSVKRFLGNNLMTPGDLEPVKRKWCGSDLRSIMQGWRCFHSLKSSAAAELSLTGEVIRVMKMPAEAALQNGVQCSRELYSRVTFIGVEQ